MDPIFYITPVMYTDSTGCLPWYDKWWGKVLIGIGIVIGTALYVAAIVASAGTVGALAGLGVASLGFSSTAVSIIATVATMGIYVVARGVALFGVSDAVEVWSAGINPNRDWVMGGNQSAYNVTRNVFDTLGAFAVLPEHSDLDFLKDRELKDTRKTFLIEMEIGVPDLTRLLMEDQNTQIHIYIFWLGMKIKVEGAFYVLLVGSIKEVYRILMYKRKVQTGYNKKLKLPIFEELTFDFFAEHIGYEWSFNYKDLIIDIAWHKNENKKIIYELNINNKNSYGKNGVYQEFDTPEELLENGRIGGKTLKDIWEDLDN